MAKKPKKKPASPRDRTAEDELEDLVELAGKLSLPDGALDGELHDAAEDEALRTYESVRKDNLFLQLRFLYMHGYQIARLEEIIRQLAGRG